MDPGAPLMCFERLLLTGEDRLALLLEGFESFGIVSGVAQGCLGTIFSAHGVPQSHALVADFLDQLLGSNECLGGSLGYLGDDFLAALRQLLSGECPRE